MKRVLHLARKEFIQTFRDRRMVALIFVAPVFQLVLFGFAATLDVDHAAFAVWDQDRSLASRELVAALINTRSFELAGALESEREIGEFFAHGRGEMVLVIPPTFSRDLAAGRTAAVQAICDGSDSNYAARVRGIVEGFAIRYNQDRLPAAIRRVQAALQQPVALPAALPGEPSIRVWYNPELKSAVFMVPAVIAVLLLVVTVVLTTLAVTRETEAGTMEHIIVTPIRPYQLILGKMAPFVVIGFIDVTLIVVAAWAIFAIPLRGSLGLLYFAALVYLFTTLGLGLLFSTVSRTQQQAMFLSFLFLMPAVMLSGFIFPISNMPRFLQLLTYGNPLRYFLVIVRGIFLKGVGLEVLWPQFVALAALGLAIFSLAVSRFQKTLG